MSLDQKIESISNSFFGFLLWMLPTSAITGALNLYGSAYDIWGYVSHQTKRTVAAVQSSFDTPLLAFFKTDTIYIPVAIQNTMRYSKLPDWIYDVDTKEFSIPNTEEIQIKSFRLPFIAATLYHKKGDTEVELGDLSEWIGGQTVCAPDGIIPLQILVSAWMYMKESPTLLMNYDDLYLKVMDDSAEETMYHVESEKEVEEVEEGEVIE
jgi:hypothetical protein